MSNRDLTNTPITPGTLSQLRVRRSILSKQENRLIENLQYLNSNTGWVRVTSSVDIDGSSEKAKSNIFIGGIAGRRGIDAYDDTKIGSRPVPGLTRFSVNSDGKYGQLRKATLSFQCWSLEQLDDFEKLYMRPGFSILVEWGHTVYYDNTGSYTATPLSVGDLMFKKTSKEEIYNKIEEVKEKSGYNYDAFFGIITNFTWKFRSDGGYDCDLQATSIGGIIESLTVDTGDELYTAEENQPLDERLLNTSLLSGVLNVFKKVTIGEGSIATIWSKIEATYPDLAKKYVAVNGVQGVNVVSKELNLPGDLQKFLYIRMDSLCGLLNAILVADQNNTPLLKFNTRIPKEGESSKVSTKFRTYDHHTSSDPGICLITSDSTKVWVKSGEYPSPIASMQKVTSDDGMSSDETLSIWVNINIVLDALNQLIDVPEKTKRTVFNFLAPILSKVSEALGGHYNELDLEYEESTYTYYVVDRKLKVSPEVYKNCPELEVTGLGSGVVSIDLTTKIPPKLSDMIAISAQAGVTDVGLDIQNLFEWNRGLEDRVLGDKFINPTIISQKVEDQNSIRESQNQKRFGTISAILEEFYNPTKAVYDEKKFQTAKINYRDYTYTYSQLYAEESDKLEDVPAGIVPFELSITMDGISGIKKLQIFKLSQGILPSYYEGIVGFIVTGIGNTIENGKWYTTVTANTINIRPSKKEAFTGNLNHRILPATLNTVLTAPGTPISYTPATTGIQPTTTQGQAMREAGSRVFKGGRGVDRLCARYSAQLGRLYVELLRNANSKIQPNLGPGGGGGNANTASHRSLLKSFGYTENYLGQFNRDTLIPILHNNSIGANIGDIVIYFRSSEVDSNMHSQIYTTGVLLEAPGAAWATSRPNNYGGSFIYKSKANYTYNLYLMRAPTR